MYPKIQFFDKLELARCYNLWNKKPFEASKGGQTSFKEFAKYLKKEKIDPDTLYYQNSIAIIIIYRCIRKIVKEQKFKGFWANVVDYTMSYMVYTFDIDQKMLSTIWRSQSIPEKYHNTIVYIAREIHSYLINKGNSEGLNIGQWCKKQDCWKEILSRIKIGDISAVTKPEAESDYQKKYEKEYENSTEKINDSNNEAVDLIVRQFNNDREMFTEIIQWLSQYPEKLKILQKKIDQFGDKNGNYDEFKTMFMTYCEHVRQEVEIEDAEIKNGLEYNTIEEELRKDIELIPRETWFEISQTKGNIPHINGVALSIAYNIGKYGNPSSKQARSGLKMLKAALKYGFFTDDNLRILVKTIIERNKYFLF